jgi:lipopolysaccharide/colanic/teichoic acid biosynthesis glycosyltransferase/GT2 family glycosyltransferase
LAEEMGVCVLRQANAGPAAARNAGAMKASGDILAFTDADCEPDPLWLKHLTQPFENPDIVGAKGAYRNRLRAVVARFIQQEYEAKYARLSRQAYIDFIDTYSAAYRRDIFIQNQGFDPAFTAASVEDQEFSFRLARKGYRMVFAPQAVVYHRHVERLRIYFKRKYNIGYWKAFMLRWLPEKALSDSHTLSSQRWQIALLGLALLCLAAGIFWPAAWVAGAVAIILFFLTDLPFFRQILRNDPALLGMAFPMLLIRAVAQILGLGIGFLFPPARQQRRTAGLSLASRLGKRLLDIAGGMAGLLLSIPLVLVSGLAIKLEDGGPVFFIQERAGENGKPFRLIKLRTMAVGSEGMVNKMLKNNPLHGPAFKIPNDPRVTRVGRFLRRWSLDELPQFWNVLSGEMSLVGPRPEETWVVALYSDEQRQRLAIKPGMTGPMQVSGRGELDMPDRLTLELEYIQHYSLGKDLWYLLRTFPAIIQGKGAF